MDAVLVAAAVVTPERVLRPGWVRVVGDRIDGVGEGPPLGGGVTDLGDSILVAGLVDVHCHGGGGESFGADAEASAGAAAAHLAHGTTSVVASLVSGPQDRMLREIASLASLVEDGVIAGVHLEGPWLSHAQCGAHDPSQLRAPSPGEVRALLANPVVRMVTLAPELDGALDAVRAIVDAGAVAALGHTDADLATTRAAIAAGARQATHLFNAMRPLRHRDPGPVLALLEDDRVALELVRDGVHLDPDLCAWLDSTVAPHRLVAVTDAMAAAAGDGGRYVLGSLDVDVIDGVARVAGTDTIAGSTATADALFRSVAGPSYDDASLQRAGLQTATNPARALGLDDVGALAAGLRADLVALDPEALRVRGVLRAGAWATAPGMR
ncbi:N-acetylglucosamine-6-phosphate deacetylase [Longivirga aurantiaca]|uniref:N-acetylglucosamine-6-phosphate deacetylase n=1 Tax=Longivirga aurantiaca TaxID=1837743 RepID=A0ABW1SZM4_9ACTN